MADGSTAARVAVERDGHVATVTLSRPEKRNALDQAMLEAIVATGEELAADAKLRAVVLTGAGQAFCAGLDFMSFAAMASAGGVGDFAGRTHGDANLFQRAGLVWHDLPVPVIAALHGTVFGGGLQIAFGADIRIAAPGTQLSIMEAKWGLIPDMGGMVLFPRAVRDDVLRRLIYTAEIFDAAQAERWGLVTEVAEDPLTAAKALAGAIAGRSPKAVRTAKRLLAEAATQDRAATLRIESELQATLIGGPEQIEAVRANMEKRPPDFDAVAKG
ncbi:MAG: crotonase/enoyl-CoA hydratase family protein [Pseudomonadota bacterium]